MVWMNATYGETAGIMMNINCFSENVTAGDKMVPSDLVARYVRIAVEARLDDTRLSPCGNS